MVMDITQRLQSVSEFLSLLYLEPSKATKLKLKNSDTSYTDAWDVFGQPESQIGFRSQSSSSQNQWF